MICILTYSFGYQLVFCNRYAQGEKGPMFFSMFETRLGGINIQVALSIFSVLGIITFLLRSAHPQEFGIQILGSLQTPQLWTGQQLQLVGELPVSPSFKLLIQFFFVLLLSFLLSMMLFLDYFLYEFYGNWILLGSRINVSVLFCTQPFKTEFLLLWIFECFDSSDILH